MLAGPLCRIPPRMGAYRRLRAGMLRKGTGVDMKRQIMAVLVGLGALGGVAACEDNDGPLEEAAEDLDEAADELD